MLCISNVIVKSANLKTAKWTLEANVDWNSKNQRTAMDINKWEQTNHIIGLGENFECWTNENAKLLKYLIDKVDIFNACTVMQDYNMPLE